ncbi:hypothetical protein [Nocardia paucivorans]|uniref:hypothetical protein n=1 Tax=Nocardia paucivorans TaxID=114259 RepID=UPI000593EA56|nr:hypothetical protein [Nocardia paucivorans]
MTQPFRILQQATERLADKFLILAKNTPESHFGEPLREAASKLSGANLKARREFLTGIDPFTGTSRSFEIRHVESVPLADSNGKVIGVKFPAQQDNADNWVRWARAERRTSDIAYSTKEPVVTPHPDGGGSRWELPEARQAPWASGDGQPPTYVFTHGNPDGERIVRELSDSGETSDIRVDGPTFGRILAANDHYRRAIEENSRITVDSTCYGDSSAEGMTAELWKAGIDTEVYAFKTTTYSWSIGSESHVDASTLSAITHSSAEEALLTDPITHYAPRDRKSADST